MLAEKKTHPFEHHTHTHTHTHHEKDRVEADQVAVQATMAEGTVEVQWFFALTAEGAGHVLATCKKCSFFLLIIFNMTR